MKKILLWSLLPASILMTGYILLISSKVNTRQTEIIRKEFAQDSTFRRDSLTDLPLLRYENDKLKKDYFVILFPGDGGWRDFIITAARTISAKGVNVVGFNTLPYFKEKRSPARIARDLERVIRNFGHAWNKKQVVLAGYSFSAEILPFAYNEMKAETRQKVRQILLIAPSNLADFKASPIYYYPKEKSLPVMTELNKLPSEKVVIFCDRHKSCLCKFLPAGSPYRTINLNAGHLFLGKEKEVSAIIAGEIL